MVVPVVLTFNRGYAKQACVAMYTALKNSNSDTLYHFYVVSNDLNDEDKQFFNKNLQDPRLQKLDFVTLPQSLYDSIPLVCEFGKETNFRFFLPELLPDLKKVLYIDSDTLILGDLTELYKTNVDKVACAGVSEIGLYQTRYYSLHSPFYTSRVEFLEKNGLNILEQHYINAGVMVVNLDYWRQHNYTARCMEFLTQNKSNEYFLYPDQDTLNVLFAQDGIDGKVLLDCKYNCTEDLLLSRYEGLDISRQLLFFARGYDVDRSKSFRPVIMHFVGGVKPWNGYCWQMGPAYVEYAQEIGWEIKIKKSSIVKRLAKFVYKVAYNLTPIGLMKVLRKHKSFFKRLVPRRIANMVKR